MKSFMPAGCVVLGAGVIALPAVAQEQLWIRQFGANFIDMAKVLNSADFGVFRRSSPWATRTPTAMATAL